MKTIKFNAIITGIRSKVDKSLGLSISTPEMTTQERSEVMNYQGINCDLTITPIDETPKGELVIDKDLHEKSKSSRLRSVLFLVWKTKEGQETFDIFYNNEMEKIIEHYKTKLD